MENLFLELIIEYKKSVEKAVILLNEESRLNPFFHRNSRKGYFSNNSSNSYEFHGYGCLIKFASGLVVDFNFGTNGRCDGFEPWFLETFIFLNIEIRNKYHFFSSYEIIEENILRLVKNKVVIKDLATKIYYFKEDYYNKNPLSF